MKKKVKQHIFPPKNGDEMHGRKDKPITFQSDPGVGNIRGDTVNFYLVGG